MENQKCPNCSANMILINNRDGTTSYKCEYCGNIISIQPESLTEKLFVMTKRAINAYNEYKDPLSKLPTEEELSRMSPKERKRAEREIRYQQAVARARRR